MDRNEGIDTLRGAAIVAVVLGHVIGNNSASGLEVADDSWARYGYFSLAYLRMPLFTVLSAMLFALRPPSLVGLDRYVRSKARRLALPLAVVGLFYVAVKAVLEGGVHGLAEQAGTFWLALIYPVDHLWFLFAIIVLLMVFSLVEATGAFRNRYRAALVVLALSAASFAVPPVAAFGIGHAARLLPFFSLGLLLVWFGRELRRPETCGALTGFLLLGVAVQQWSWFAEQPDLRTIWLRLVVGVAGCSLLVAARWEWPPLASLGRYAFTIYLFHIFFTSGIRRVLLAGGVDSVMLHCLIGTVVGVVGPIVVHHVAVRHPLTRVSLLGLRWGERPRTDRPTVVPAGSVA